MTVETCVSTLLEILGHWIWVLFMWQGSRVSTLLEILAQYLMMDDALSLILFQPFLRFWYRHAAAIKPIVFVDSFNPS